MSKRLQIAAALEELGGEPLDGSGFEDELADQMSSSRDLTSDLEDGRRLFGGAKTTRTKKGRSGRGSGTKRWERFPSGRPQRL